eukprot:8637326-Heterocapsa_arctica.AAC.1
MRGARASPAHPPHHRQTQGAHAPGQACNVPGVLQTSRGGVDHPRRTRQHVDRRVDGHGAREDDQRHLQPPLGPAPGAQPDAVG